MLTPYRSRLLASTLLVSAVFAAAPALAQDADPASQPKTGVQSTDPNAPSAGISSADSAPPAGPNSSGDIVVTGTLISNPNLIASSPITVVGQEEINLRQSNTAEQILRDLPGAVPSIGSAVNNGNGGASYVDLRGLGSFRNVVLLDGNRIAPSGLVGRVDLNNIPLALVERVDTLTGGAATTYGADAVSGVINFITRSDFSGVEVSASNQITEKGDGNYVRTDVTIGANFDDGRGNAVFSIGYQQADPVYQGDRSFGVNNIDSFTGTAGGSGTTVPARFTRPGSPQQTINPATGALQANGLNGVGAPFNFNPYNIFQTPFERFNMYGAGHYELSDSIEVYSRGLFSKNTVQTIIAPSGVFASAVTINYNNPYLPAAAASQFGLANGLTAAQIAAARVATGPTDPNYRTFTTTVSRRFTEAGPRISNYQTTLFDYKVGVRAGITDAISLDVSGAYGESENTQTLQGYVLTSRVRQAALANNTTTCITNTNGCVPLNLFGADGSITPAQVGFVSAESTSTIRTSLAQARAVLSGDLGFSSPFADEAIGFAAGTEYRKYQAAQRSDSLAQQAGELGGAGGAAPNITGGYEVYEGYGELIAPLVQDKPFFQSLTLEAGVRYSHYKVFAPTSPTYNTTTYKGGGSWEPVNGLKFRGNYQRAVRAPNISELFSPTNTGLTSLSTDPCASLNEQGTVIAPAPTGELRAICLAQGAPVGQLGIIQTPTAGQAAATSGGNLNLRPEKSDSYTAGVVIQPTNFIPGLSITVDYYNIKVKGAVSSPTPGDAITACFGGGDGRSPAAGASATPACLSIGRNPVTGGLAGDPATTTGLFLALSNLGTLKTDGIDLGVNYRRDLGIAKFNLSFQGNWTNSSKFLNAPGGFNRDCVGFYSVNCPSIQPEFYWNTRATFSFDTVDMSVLWRHIDSVEQEPDDIINGNGPVADGFGNIKAYNYIDLASRFGVSDNFDMTITVSNLFDKKPPIVGSTVGSTSYNSGNTYPSTYDALGRSYKVGARLKF